ncbi:MAG: 1-acyl-sn-glycerol-3-phosphate acyltransferase [Chloroflexi bacterium]|nr:1-acyl-sn-glycerol-3-phosphate acyltransferase [Chloroflexota bacterium]
MKPETLRVILGFLIQKLTRTEIIGAENVPMQGACILATNHMSRLDVPLLFVVSPRPVIALVADSYRTNPLFYFLVKTSGSIWIDRAKADFSAVRLGLEHLRKGGMLGIAPEGTRSRVGALLQAKTGTAMLADKAGVPVIPVAISGTEIGMLHLLRLARPRFRVCFGKPLILPPIEREDREGSLQRNTDEIMCRIAALLPEKYHGYYAGHPRLKEILNSPS